MKSPIEFKFIYATIVSDDCVERRRFTEKKQLEVRKARGVN